MKKRLFTAATAIAVAVSVHAQSTVDSIASKYKLLPMPAAATMEEAFPVLGNYQLTNAADSAGGGTLTVTLDSSNKGMVWVEGLPQGKLKAYLRKSPATYRITSQKTASGRQIQEGTLYYDTTSRNLNIAIGKAYNEADPTGIFAMGQQANATAMAGGETNEKTGNAKMKTSVSGNKVKTKTKTAAGKDKAKVWFYTATKVGQDNMMNTNPMNNNMQMQHSDSTKQHSDSTHQQQ